MLETLRLEIVLSFFIEGFMANKTTVSSLVQNKGYPFRATLRPCGKICSNLKHKKVKKSEE